MSDQPESILVLGASGGLGQYICREVIRQFGAGALIVGDYQPARGEQLANKLGTAVSFIQADVNDPDILRAALGDGVTAVIVAVAQQIPLAQTACIEAGIPCLDVTVQPENVIVFAGIRNQLHV